MDDVRITLARGAVIAGHLRDAAGAPAANIPVRVVPAAAALGPGEYAPAFDALTTDPSGAYRAFNLPPGEYVVVAALGNLSGRGPIYRPTAAEIDVDGTILGAFPEARFAQREVMLEPDDVLLIVSDGILEAPDEMGRRPGLPGLRPTLDRWRQASPAALAEALAEETQARGGGTLRDDVTVVALRR